MKIECSVEELKELLNKETPVVVTTDAVVKPISTKLNWVNELSNQIAKNLTNYDIHEVKS